jgi:hypothetical protein
MRRVRFQECAGTAPPVRRFHKHLPGVRVSAGPLNVNTKRRGI